MPEKGSWMARASSGALRAAEATVGAAGRGGRTAMLTGGSGAWGTVCAAGEWEAATVALYRKASDGSAVAAGEVCVAPLSARSGLMGRHSSSKVTERLEITVLVAGKYTIQDLLLGV